MEHFTLKEKKLSILKTFLILFGLFTYSDIVAQTSRKISFPKISWTIDLPSDFIVSDSNTSKAILKEGVELVENKSNVKLDTSETVVLIVANKDVNYFSAIITPFNPKISSWIEEHENLKINSYQLMKETVPNASIDTLSSKVKIDGIIFENFKITPTLEGEIVSSVIALWKLYMGYDLGITYSFNNDEIREQIESMLSKSKFSK